MAHRAKSTLIETIAAAAHEAWCHCMREEGWTYGPAYNEFAMTHDAMVPFADLDPEEQAEKIHGLECEDVVSILAELLHYDRSASRPLRLSELRVGLRVEAVNDDPDDDTDASRGQIVGWTTSESSGLLEEVRVRWDDGDESEHGALECELRRVDELE